MPHLEARWLPSLRTFLKTINGHIETDHPFIPPPQRQHDSYIMDRALKSSAWSPLDIRHLNYCRMFVQAITILDLCLANGTHADEDLLTGDPSTTSSVSTLLHYNQAKPSKAAWKTWKLLMNLWFYSNGELKKPLGPWLTTGLQLRRSWNAYYDHRSRFLYIRSGATFNQLERATDLKDDSDEVFSYSVSSEWTPNEHSLPVDVYCCGPDMWTLSHQLPPLPPTTPPCFPATFQDYLHALPPWELILFESLEMHRDCYQILELINQFQSNDPDVKIHLLSVSDGSAVPCPLAGSSAFPMDTALHPV
jgi:hypothetical protein